MKLTTLMALMVLPTIAFAQTPTNPPAASMNNPPKLMSAIYDWRNLQPVAVSNGVRRRVFDGPTTTLDKINCHITTLNPGKQSGEPRLHVQEEAVVVKEGTVEATYDGYSQTVGPGSVIYYYTPLTPKK